MTDTTSTEAPAASPVQPANAHPDLLPPAERADFQTTRAALQDALKDTGPSNSLEQIRIKPDPDSEFGKHCAQKSLQLRAIQTPEFTRRITRKDGTLRDWFIEMDDSVKVLTDDAQAIGVTSDIPPTVLRRRREQTETLAEPARTDGSVSLALMLRYNYGISLPESRDTATINGLLNTLAEVQASQELGLLDQFDISALLTPDMLSKIRQTCAEYLNDEPTTLLGKLGAHLLATHTQEHIRTSPVAVIAQILRSEQATTLGQAILARLQWPESETARSLATLTDRILWHAISDNLQAQETRQPDSIAGYSFTQDDNWGRSHSAILTDLHHHLIATQKAASMNEAVVAGVMLALDDHPEWLISDVPDDLPYGCTEVWVSFQHGVALAESIEFGSSRWMSFDALIEMPAVFSKKMDTEEQQIAYVALRMPALLTWAQVNGHLRAQADPPYSQQEIELAISAFEHAEAESFQAVNALARPAPQRREMAIEIMAQTTRTPEITRILEQENYQIPAYPLTAGQKLVPKSYPPVYLNGHGTASVTGHPYSAHEINRKVYTLLDVYVSGEDINDWRIPGFFMNEKPYPVFRETELLYKSLPPINPLFEQDFANHLKDTRQAYATLIRKLLVHLPLKHRIAIENGEVTLYSLRLPVKDVMAATENEQHREPLRGRSGFVLKTVYQHMTTYYEVFPLLMIIRHRPDLEALVEGGIFDIESWAIASVITTPVMVRAGTPMPFDQRAYLQGHEPQQGATAVLIAERLAPPLPPSTANLPQHLPLTTLTQRCITIANTVKDRLFHVNTDALYEQCKGATPIELERAGPDLFKAVGNFLVRLTPWPEIQDVISGEKSRMRSGSLGLALFVIPYAGHAGKLLGGIAKIGKGVGKSLLARNGKTQLSRLKHRVAQYMNSTSRMSGRPDRAMMVKMTTGMLQFVQNHVTWKFVAVRVGVGVSRRLVAEAGRLEAQNTRNDAEHQG
ncbi:hypothetical protein SAMN05216593_107145 [Pseudomonas asturiensis]|uniref:Uncharacterized protein n=1 Tax=Pseudomonas asturiensis TaxID=1190415 RepID=A0A1M7NXM0_9PSED|nr:MFS transporter [Pseudomonas asturiensis]SHN08895.1 hypothetical protein SAMN05216593_107145 [Pseudomonas asturiensis]